MLKFNQIYNMDCIEGMKHLSANSVDAIITDVPYNMGEVNPNLIKFKTREDMNKSNVEEWNKDFNPIEWLPGAKRVLKEDGNVFIFTGDRNFGSYFSWLDGHFDRRFFGVWHKTNPVPQVRKVSFLSSLELFVCAWNLPHTWNFTKQNEMHNMLEYPICQGKERVNHTTQKPLKLMSHIIKIATNEGGMVLDPFIGSGSTAVASKLLNRHYIGFEISGEYCKIADARLASIPVSLECFGGDM